MGSQDQSPFSMKVFAVLSVLAAVCSANLPVPGSIPGLSIDQQYQYILQLQDHLNQQVQWNERREVFQFQEPSLVLFQVLLLRPNGTKPNWLPLLEEGREVFQFQEQLALSQDLLLRLNGINKTLLKLPLIMEERREVCQFQEQLALFQDQLLRLNGINKTLLKLPLIMEEG